MGRVRLGRAEDRPEAVADGCGLQLGDLLRQARQGRDERNVEVRLLLRDDQGRLHEPCSVRAEGQPEDEAAILAKQKAIVAGKFNVFTGPILDQKGKVVVPKGKTLKVLPDLYTMQWLVKGVDGRVSTVLPPG